MNQTRLDNQALIILGMQRSGTSATSGALLRLGLNLGSKFLVPDRFNPTGYYELDIIPSLDRDMLNSFGRSWSDPRALPDGWEHLSQISFFREKIRGYLLENFAGINLWGIKYPNLCRLLPLWLPLLEQLGVGIKVLVVVRRPTEVAASLAVRNQMPLEQSLALWLGHMIPAVLETKQIPRSVLLYDDLLKQGPSEIERIVEELSLPLPPVDNEKKDKIAKFLTRDLRHHEEPRPGTAKGPWLEWAERAYSAAISWRHEGTDPEKVFLELRQSMSNAEETATPYTQYTDHVKAKVEQIEADYLSSFSLKITKPLRFLKKGLFMLKKNPRSL